MRNHTKRVYLLFLLSFLILLVSGCHEKEDKKVFFRNDEATEWAESLPDKIDGNYLQVIDLSLIHI